MLLFLSAALLPVLLSDWLSIDVMTQVAERFDLESRQQTTRQVSRQVLDRLLAAKDVMTSAVQARSILATGPSEIFLGTAFPVCNGERKSNTDDICLLWEHAAPPQSGVAPRRDDGVATHVELRIWAKHGAPTRLLLGARLHGALVGVAELRPDFVWAPIIDSNEDTVWSVQDAYGRMLMQHRGADVETATTSNRTFEAQLFLTSALASDSWRFEQRAPVLALHWHGMPLAGWLGGVALATLLVVGLYGGRRIRHTLGPLEELTHGTRQLAAGLTGTRVAVRGNDEISALGNAFNEMAGKLDIQFSTLRNLSHIDAGILSGAPMGELAQRVADQLLRLYPESLPTVHWREGANTLRSVSGGADAGTSVDFELTATQVEQFEGISDGNPLDPSLAAPLTTLGITAHSVMMTIEEAGRTRALIALRFVEVVPTGALKPAHNLKDRLAVALVTRAREQQLVHRAVHDQLTGLANNFALQTHLERLLSEAGRAELAVLFIDLDHFKEVNDHHGHGVGDELLKLVGTRIQTCLPEAALLARKGGDEFVVVFPGASADEACACAVRIGEALDRPALLRGILHSCNASIGIALGPEHGSTQEELLRCADVALYVAKGAGRSRHAVFSASFDHAARERASLLAALRLAVANNELVVHYQPRLRSADGVITSAEALVRWQHPQRGLMLPGSFIELAESSGLIGSIGEWVLDRACAQVAQWQEQGCGLERVSVNVSAHQLSAGDLPDKVATALMRHGIAPYRLELEVTESLLVDDARAAHAQLTQLKTLGVTIAMDDFGTGHSSMALLRKLPIDVLKIDRAFVTDMVDDRSALAITRTIVTLAKSLSLRLVAEGIETEGQAALLRSMGCDE